MRLLSSAGLVYYVLDATRREQFVKIGYTTNLRQRIIDLRGITTSGQSPIVLAVEDGGPRVEQERHREFHDLRSHGEWFRYDDPLRKLIADMEHPFAYLLDRPHLWPYTGGWGPLGQEAPAQRPPAQWALPPPVDEDDDPMDDRPPIDF